MISTLLGLFSHDLAIDLGTSNTLIYVSRKGIVLREPTVIARNRKTKEVLAVGSAAKKMLGRSGKSIEVVRPLKNGFISDIDATISLLSFLIRKVHSNSKIASKMPRPKVVVGVPASVSPVQRKAVSDAFSKAGARKVIIVDEALAAAFGDDIKIDSMHGVGVIDIGAGTTDIAIVASKQSVFGRSINIAGDEMDQAIVDYMRLKYSLLVGETSAESLKIGVATAIKDKEHFNIIRGRSLEEGVPKSVKVGSFEIYETLLPLFEKITLAVSDLLKEAPPELSGDISERGIIISGGGALIRGINDYFSKSLNVPVRVTADPLTAVVRGCAKILEGEYEKSSK